MGVGDICLSAGDGIPYSPIIRNRWGTLERNPDQAYHIREYY